MKAIEQYFHELHVNNLHLWNSEIWFLALFKSRDKRTESTQQLINIALWTKQPCTCDKKLSGTFNSVTDDSHRFLSRDLKDIYTVKNELFPKRIVITYYSHIVFLTLVLVPSIYHASNGEIPSVKPGFFQPIFGPLQITQHREENVTWLLGCQVALQSVTFLIKDMTKNWCITANLSVFAQSKFSILRWSVVLGWLFVLLVLQVPRGRENLVCFQSHTR